MTTPKHPRQILIANRGAHHLMADALREDRRERGLKAYHFGLTRHAQTLIQCGAALFAGGTTPERLYELADFAADIANTLSKYSTPSLTVGALSCGLRMLADAEAEGVV